MFKFRSPFALATVQTTNFDAVDFLDEEEVEWIVVFNIWSVGRGRGVKCRNVGRYGSEI